MFESAKENMTVNTDECLKQTESDSRVLIRQNRFAVGWRMAGCVPPRPGAGCSKDD